MFDGCIITNNNRVAKIRQDTLSFSVDTIQVEFLPDALQEVVHVKVRFARNDCGVRLAGKTVDFFNGDDVDFVVHVEAGNVFAVPQDHVDEIVC